MKTLEQVLARQSAASRARGREYQREGRVKILERAPNLVRAVVQGSERYKVQFALDNLGWRVSCTCLAFDGFGGCKHVSALLYELTEGKTRTAAIARIDEEADDGFVSEDELLHQALADRNIPDAVKRRLVEAFAIGDISTGSVSEKQMEKHRTQRVITTLDTLSPTTNAPGRTTALRYVLIPGAVDVNKVAMEVHVARANAKGEFGAFKAVRTPPHDTELDETDRMGKAVLIEGTRQHASSYYYTTQSSEVQLSPALQRMLLPRFAAEDRLWVVPEEGQQPVPVVLDAGDPWSFALEVDSGAKEFTLQGVLRRGDDRLPLEELFCVLAGGFAYARGALITVDWHGAHTWAAHLAGEKPVTLGRDRASDLRRVLSKAPLAMPVRAEGLVEDVHATPKPVLVLFPPKDPKTRIDARIDFDYDGVRVRRSASSVIVKGERILRVRRDAAAEARAVEGYVAAGGTLFPGARDMDGTVVPKHLARLVRTLVERGWSVEGEGILVRPVGEFEVGVKSGIDWFDVETNVSFDGELAALPALLEALRERRPFVSLADGSLGVVPEQWFERWSTLAKLGELDDGVLRVPRARAFLLDVLLAEKLDARVDDGFRALRERFAKAREPAPLAQPKGFRGTLRPYQRAGLGWLAFLGETGLGGCLADDMGLGKTIQVLAHVLRRKKGAKGPALVVAPNSLIFNWKSEAERFTPGLDVLLHHGTARAKQRAKLEDADVVVTTYGTLRQDAKLLAEVAFDLVVLDEAQAIKNASSQSAKAARLLEADQRLALTGTPIENRIQDLLSIFEFLNPGLLEGSRALRGMLDGDGELDTVRLASKALAPFLLRRTKAAVLKDLPAKIEQVVSCELEGTQRREYDALKEHYRRTLLAKVDEVGMEKAGMNVLEALLRLRQAACHLALVDPDHAKTRSAKLETLMEMLEELAASGHKALVFSQFTSFLGFVKKELDSRGVTYEYLDGKTQKRQERVDAFQEDESKRVFLISLKAGGVGLNLTAADYVFLLDPWWNPAVERQAIDRTHRIGQTRPVTAYRLVARDTVEEKVLALQEKKRELADALFEGAGRALGDLTREDLVAILA